MRKRVCPNCESAAEVVEKKISIPVGTEAFSTRARICKKCGSYELTPQIRREMDQWGRALTKNIIEPQPIFSEATHRFAEEMATQYGLKRVPLFRVPFSVMGHSVPKSALPLSNCNTPIVN